MPVFNGPENRRKTMISFALIATSLALLTGCNRATPTPVEATNVPLPTPAIVEPTIMPTVTAAGGYGLGGAEAPPPAAKATLDQRATDTSATVTPETVKPTTPPSPEPSSTVETGIVVASHEKIGYQYKEKSINFDFTLAFDTTSTNFLKSKMGVSRLELNTDNPTLKEDWARLTIASFFETYKVQNNLPNLTFAEFMNKYNDVTIQLVNKQDATTLSDARRNGNPTTGVQLSEPMKLTDVKHVVRQFNNTGNYLIGIPTTPSQTHSYSFDKATGTLTITSNLPLFAVESWLKNNNSDPYYLAEAFSGEISGGFIAMPFAIAKLRDNVQSNDAFYKNEAYPAMLEIQGLSNRPRMAADSKWSDTEGNFISTPTILKKASEYHPNQTQQEKQGITNEFIAFAEEHALLKAYIK